MRPAQPNNNEDNAEPTQDEVNLTFNHKMFIITKYSLKMYNFV